MFRSRKESHEKAYGEGVRDAQNSSFGERFKHGIGDVAGSVTPHHTSSTSKSYEAGYHSGKGRRGRSSRSTYSGASSGSYRTLGDKIESFIGAVVCLFIAGVAAGLVGLLIVRHNQEQERKRNSSVSGGQIGQVKAVKSPQLNMRSGPGSEYEIVKVFDKGEKIISIGEPENINGSQWIRAATPDGQIEGWVNRKYIYP